MGSQARWRCSWLVGVGASFASSLRGLSGAAIVIAAACRDRPPTRDLAAARRLGLGVLLVIAYLSVIPIGTGLVRANAEELGRATTAASAD